MARLTVVEPAAPTALKRLVEDFLAHSRAKGHAPKTIEASAFALKRVVPPWCAREHVTEPSQVTTRLLDRLSNHLLDEGGARAAVEALGAQLPVRPINHFLNWAREDGAAATGKAQLPGCRARFSRSSAATRSGRWRTPPSASATRSSCGSWRTPAFKWADWCGCAPQM